MAATKLDFKRDDRPPPRNAEELSGHKGRGHSMRRGWQYEELERVRQEVQGTNKYGFMVNVDNLEALNNLERTINQAWRGVSRAKTPSFQVPKGLWDAKHYELPDGTFDIHVAYQGIASAKTQTGRASE